MLRELFNRNFHVCKNDPKYNKSRNKEVSRFYDKDYRRWMKMNFYPFKGTWHKPSVYAASFAVTEGNLIIGAIAPGKTERSHVPFYPVIISKAMKY